MINLTQQDLEVRLQLANCCIADKARLLNTAIQTGSKSTECKLQELQVLEVMLEILRCYRVYETPVQEYSSFNVVREFFNPIDQELTFYINGIQISPLMLVNQFAANQIALIVDDINNYQSDYLATWVDLNTFTITPVIGCGDFELTYITNDPDGTVLTITPVEGECELVDNNDLNCITEEEVHAMFDYISGKCDICFQRPGFNYES